MLKFGALIVVALVVIFVVESAVFHIAGRNGWMVGGPVPVDESHMEWLVDRFGRVPATTEGGMVLAPLTPPNGSTLDAPEWYRAEDAGGPEQFEAAKGLIVYSIGAEPRIPHLSPMFYLVLAINTFRGDNHLDVWIPVASGTAIITSEGELWCRIMVQPTYFFRVREYVGSVGDFMPLPSAKGWRTARIHPFVLAHNVAVLLLLFGWPFFIGDARAAIRRWRMRRDEKSKRLPRPTTLRAIGVRFIMLVIGAGALAYAIDIIVFPRAMAAGTALVFSVVTEEDEAWWKASMGKLPPETWGPFYGPRAIEAVQGSWLVPYGAHGGMGAPGRSTQPLPESLIAYSIVPNPHQRQRLPLRGRVLAGSDGRLIYRIEMPLPFVIRDRTYIGSITDDEFIPNPLDERWQVRIRPLGYLANAALYFLILGLPIYVRDARAALRIMRGRCTSCGYLLRGLPGPRCPECGCGIAARNGSKQGRSEQT